MKKDLDLILSYTKESGDCLEWTRCLNTDGYPRAAVDGDYNAKIHRVVWELFNKKSAEGLVVRHKCDNPICINPKHLEIGTSRDNVMDRVVRGRTHNNITEENISEIIELLDAGFRQTEIAKILRIKYKRVNHIKLNLIG